MSRDMCVLCACAALVGPVLRSVRACILRIPPGWVVLHRLARAPSCHGFSRPSLAEPDVIDAADLAGDDLVAGAVDGALKRHPLGVLLGFFGVTGREVRLVKFALDQLDLERPHRRTIGPGFALLA